MGARKSSAAGKVARSRSATGDENAAPGPAELQGTGGAATGTFWWRVASDEFGGSARLYRLLELDSAPTLTLARLEARVHADDRPLFRNALADARRTGRDFEQELRLRLPHDVVKHVRVVAQRVGGTSGGVEYIGAIEDTTEQLAARQLLDKARLELARVNRVMSLAVLTASIAHEINQPLSGVVTSASTCLRLLAADPPNVEGARETTRRTIQCGHRAAEVTKRLRALFSQGSVTTEPLDLNEATRDVMALSSNDLLENRVEATLELANDLPLVTGDRVQLQQVILNLILNALDAMKDVDDRPRRLRVCTERYAGSQVRLAVCDSGKGFEPGDMRRLFEAFYTTKAAGMGIGLSVSRSIVERHGGRIWAAANEGPGVTFFCALPNTKV